MARNTGGHMEVQASFIAHEWEGKCKSDYISAIKNLPHPAGGSINHISNL
jgi:hypothetical protein